MTIATPFWLPVPVGGWRYRLPASDAACVGIPGRRAPMGGVTTGAAIEAMEQATGSALYWASSQFVSAAPTETDFEIEVLVVVTASRVKLGDEVCRAFAVKDEVRIVGHILVAGKHSVAMRAIVRLESIIHVCQSTSSARPNVSH